MNAKASLGDRYAEVSVLVVTIIALAFGWMLKAGVENRSLPFSSAGLAAEAPAGWLQADTAPGEVLHVTDRTAQGFGTTYILQQEAVTADASPEKVASLLSLQRGQQLTAYRVLEQQAVTVDGRQAYKVSYVFVESDPNVTHANLPSVVHGADFILLGNNQAVIVTYWAEQDNYDADYGRFLRFLSSVKF